MIEFIGRIPFNCNMQKESSHEAVGVGTLEWAMQMLWDLAGEVPEKSKDIRKIYDIISKYKAEGSLDDAYLRLNTIQRQSEMVAAALRKLCSETQVDRKTIAGFIGLSPFGLSNIVRNRNPRNFPRQRIEELCQTLGLQAEDFIEMEIETLAVRIHSCIDGGEPES